MCRINMIYVKNDNYGILEQNGYESIENDDSELTNGYTGYVCGWCNCDSFVGSMLECENSYDTLEEMSECESKIKLARLQKIREFMYQPGYQKLRKDYIEKKEVLFGKLFELTEEIDDYEIEQSFALEKKYNYQIPPEAADAMYQEIEEKRQLIYESDEYQAIQKKIDVLQKENPILEESTMYYLTQEEMNEALELGEQDEELDEEMQEFLDNLIEENGVEEELEEIEIKLPSFVIDEAIKELMDKLEHPEITDQATEFHKYKDIFEQLLETNEKIMFTTVWSEPENLKHIREINIKKMVIEDLAKLNYNKVLTITN